MKNNEKLYHSKIIKTIKVNLLPQMPQKSLGVLSLK
jgi:hypothetical protein